MRITSTTPDSATLAAEARAYRGRVIRIVEAQHRISTNRLASNAVDQTLLETLADEVKPQLPDAALTPPPRPHSSWAFLATGDGLLATREMSDEAWRFTPSEFDMSNAQWVCWNSYSKARTLCDERFLPIV